MVLSTSRPEGYRHLANLVEAGDAHHRHRVRILLIAQLYVIGVPGAAGLVFSDAHGVLAWVPEGGVVRFPWNGATYIAHYQPERPTNGGIGPVSVAECATVRVDVQAARQGAVENNQRSGSTGGGLDTADVQLLPADRLYGGLRQRGSAQVDIQP